MDYLKLTYQERRALEKQRADKIAALSDTAKAAFETVSQWGGSISPELAQAISQAVLEANEKHAESIDPS